MSDPTDIKDIKALEEYLKGGSDISQRYRELGRDDVPPELDRRVLAQARAAVANEGPRRSRSWLRWSAPVALAASVVLVVAVVIESGVPKDTAYVAAPASEESKLYDEQPAQAPERSLAKAELDDKRLANSAPEEVRVEAKARRDQLEQATPVTTVSSVVDAAEPQLAAEHVAPVPQLQSVQQVAARETLERGEAEADSDLSEVSVSGSRTRRATGRTAGPRNTISGAGLSGEMRQSVDSAAKADQREPEKWLEEIRELRRKGRITDADREWQRFSEAYPDFEVADGDIARQH